MAFLPAIVNMCFFQSNRYLSFFFLVLFLCDTFIILKVRTEFSAFWVFTHTVTLISGISYKLRILTLRIYDQEFRMNFFDYYSKILEYRSQNFQSG